MEQKLATELVCAIGKHYIAVVRWNALIFRRFAMIWSVSFDLVDVTMTRFGWKWIFTSLNTLDMLIMQLNVGKKFGDMDTISQF